MGRNVGSGYFTRYSDALKNAGGVWSKERLTAFLKDPPAFASGTLMPKLDLDDDTINTIVEFLEHWTLGR